MEGKKPEADIPVKDIRGQIDDYHDSLFKGRDLLETYTHRLKGTEKYYDEVIEYIDEVKTKLSEYAGMFGQLDFLIEDINGDAPQKPDLYFGEKKLSYPYKHKTNNGKSSEYENLVSF